MSDAQMPWALAEVKVHSILSHGRDVRDDR